MCEDDGIPKKFKEANTTRLFTAEVSHEYAGKKLSTMRIKSPVRREVERAVDRWFESMGGYD